MMKNIHNAIFYSFTGFVFALIVSLSACNEHKTVNSQKVITLNKGKKTKGIKSCCSSGKPDRFTKNKNGM